MVNDDYYQCLCEEGHYYITNGDPERDSFHCHVCNKDVIWLNLVKEDNSEGYIPMESLKPFLIEDEVGVVCSEKHRHIKVHATYRFPSNDETEKLRTVIKDGKRELIYSPPGKPLRLSYGEAADLVYKRKAFDLQRMSTQNFIHYMKKIDTGWEKWSLEQLAYNFNMEGLGEREAKKHNVREIVITHEGQEVSVYKVPE